MLREASSSQAASSWQRYALGVLLFTASCLLPAAGLTAEAPTIRELELQLQLIETQRQIAFQMFERGQALMEVAQLRSRLLAQEEVSIRAKIEELKATTKKPEAPAPAAEKPRD